MTSNGGSSVLSNMVAGVMQNKAAGGAKPTTLTPTVLETPNRVAPLGGKHDVMFPFDDPQTIDRAILDGLKMVNDLYQTLNHVRDGLIALAGLYGTPVEDDQTKAAIAAQAEKEQRAKEAQADAKAAMAKAKDAPKPPETPEEFKEDFARKQAEAQAAVFGNPAPTTPAPVLVDIPDEDDDDDEDEAEAPKPAGWVCPTHGKAVTKRSARRQVDYNACPECDQFEHV